MPYTLTVWGLWMIGAAVIGLVIGWLLGRRGNPPVDDAPRHGIGAVAHLGGAPVLTLPPSLPEPPPLVIAAPAGRIITSPRTPNARPQHTPRQARAPPA